MNTVRILKTLDEIEEKIRGIRHELEQAQEDTPKPTKGASEKIATAGQVPPDVIEIIGEGNPVKEIIGGVTTINFPDCCAVGQVNNYYCSGTLIAPTVVVTANHCQNITHIFIGGHDVLDPLTGETIGVIAQREHPNIDLRVLILEKAPQVQPRHIAQGVEVGNPQEAIVAGFGTVNPRGTTGYGIKRMARVPIKTLNCTGVTEPDRFGCQSDQELVAGHLGLRIDTCRGDSGGPLYIEAPTKGEYYLLGATSRGARNAENVCGDGGIYVRVDLCLDWIRKVTGIEIEGPKS